MTPVGPKRTMHLGWRYWYLEEHGISGSPRNKLRRKLSTRGILPFLRVWQRPIFRSWLAEP